MPSLPPVAPAYLGPALELPSRASYTSSSLLENLGPRPLPASASTSILSGARSGAAPPALQSSTPSSIARAGPDTIRCKGCLSDLAFSTQIASRQFSGRFGRGILVVPRSGSTTSPSAETGELLNTLVGPRESRVLATGKHGVADVQCAVCKTNLGWKYLDAAHQSQRYKVGMYILEAVRVAECTSVEDADALARASTKGVAGADLGAGRDAEVASMQPRVRSAPDADEGVQFDSEDEDECDALFSGKWSAHHVAAKRLHRTGSTAVPRGDRTRRF